MGKQIVRVGDVNSAGGKVLTGDNSVRINGIPVAVDGSPVSCHAPTNNSQHVHARCRASVNNIRVNGKRLIFVGDTDTCGHKRVQGSSNTNG
jgi:uncharacterized Zn-binding protein involved in type VI secretion